MPLRSLLPWRRFDVDTAWSPTEVDRELGILLESSRWQDMALHGARWLGGFRMVLDGLTVFRRAVILSGRVQPKPTGSHVVVTIRFPMPAMVFLVVTIPLLAGLSLAVSLAALVRHEAIVLLIWTAPFAMWSGMLRPFQSEARKAEHLFRKLLPPPVLSDTGPFR
jgi:hypothetical protein